GGTPLRPAFCRPGRTRRGSPRARAPLPFVSDWCPGGRSLGLDRPSRRTGLWCARSTSVGGAGRAVRGTRAGGVRGVCGSVPVRPPQASREKPKVSAFLTARTDKILQLKPDLVIGFSDLQADIARELAKAGLNVMLFNQRSVEEILNMIQVLSSVVGVGDKGVQLVKRFEAGLAEIRESAKQFVKKPKVYFEEWD